MDDIVKTEKPPLPKKRAIWRALYERLGLKHLSYRVPAHAQTLPYMLGGLSLAAFGILFASGIYLAQFYNPNQIGSNESILFLISHVPFGNFVRSIHFWAANVVFGLIIFHMVRVFITGSYKRPREITWLTGLGLLAVTMAFIFTGTMLSLGQEGIEALEHAGEMGHLLGAWGMWFTGGFSASLPLVGRMYVAHITILVVLFILFIIAHFYLIKVHGMSPEAGKNAVINDTSMENTGQFGEHLKKLLGWSFILLAFISLLALLFPESLSGPGLAGIEATKPPWMFLWLYGMENIFGITSLVWGPALLFLLLAAIPFIDRSPYLSPRRRPWIMVIGAIIALALIILSVEAWRSPIEAPMGYLPNAIAGWLLPIPVAYAHNMPYLSFSPLVATPGRAVTFIGDGLKTDGEYDIYLTGSQTSLLLGKAEVASGEDSFDADLPIPAGVPGDMYSVEMRSVRDTQFDFFAPLQLAVQPAAVPESRETPAYAKYPIPSKEIPWIAALIVISLGLGMGILHEK